MTYQTVVDLAQHTLMMALLLSAPLLVSALVVGLAVSVVQTVTQVQEQTVAFVVKLLAVGIVFFVLLPWTLQTSVGFSTEIVRAIPAMVR
ncbi:flagellar biosynthetic protein FliQ [Gaopeijia maritima]|uniref:Flagellar biosynthetic protein FliQ n=1 Tax=Gaopeijia maritima TaxID=3119007 RepID=A0ABU9ECQ5_9BACT